MSSILDALKKVDSATPGQQPMAVLPQPLPPKNRGPLAIGTAVAVGVILLVSWYRNLAPVSEPTPAGPLASAPDTGTVTATIPATTPPAPALGRDGLPVAQPVPPPAVATVGERPWVRTEPRTPPTTEPPREVAPLPATLPMTLPTAPPPPPVVVSGRPAVTGLPPVAAEPPPVMSRGAAQADSVRVSFLAYSRIPDLRTVTLAVDGGRLVTLHEGDAANGIVVTRIYPDRVDLVRDGVAFTARARN